MWDTLGFVVFIAFILVLLEYPLWSYWWSWVERGIVWINNRCRDWWVR